MDPVMGVVGGVVIARWSWSLLRETARVLLDGGVSVVSATPRAPGHYRALLAGFEDLAHVTVEVHGAAER
jgi:hypothetical protein